jgi:peptidoglycan/xylan/chitin deacetylase (PgdA/CDA1 family)
MEQTSRCGTVTEAYKEQAGRRWRPSPGIRVSVAFHLTGLAGIALDPMSWSYIGAALAGNHVVLGLAGMWPRSTLLGPNVRRLPEASASRSEIALTFDDGPDPSVTLRVLDLLDRYDAKASFFCVGAKAAAYPSIVQEIAHRGHSVENHSHTHPAAFAAYGISRLRAEIEAAQDTLASICGRAPAFFRAPAGLRSPLLDPVLARLGLTYVSWTRRGFDTVDSNPTKVLNRLVHRLSAGDVLALHDRSSRTRDREAVILSVLPMLMNRIQAQQLKPVSLAAACRS